MIHLEGKLAGLRDSMESNGIDYYLIRTADPHLGENIPEHWQIISWLTGFTGSNATVIVTFSFAGLWTDSRYFMQAREQLKDSAFSFIEPESAGGNDYIRWLEDNVDENSVLGTDSRTISVGMWRKIEKALAGKNIKYMTDIDLVSAVWTDRPALSASLAFDFPVIYAGKARAAKIAEVRNQMAGRSLDYHLLASPDDIMWMLNIRGGDVKYSPLLSAFAIVGMEQVLLFADEDKFSYSLASELDRIGVVILPYLEIAAILSHIPEESSILISTESTSLSLYNAIPRGMRISEGLSIPAKLKAVKNNIESAHIGKAMVRDGVALTRFFYWIEQNFGSEPMTEISVASMLESFRSGNEGYMGPSFPAIVAFREHGAMPHYTATPESDTVIAGDGLLLVDSGGQYVDGTTDITRTVAIGRPSSVQIRDFTLVLKGNIALATVKIPYGTKGIQLDILARKALWDMGLNYGHGTGHGVGFFLNVHEGPQSISPLSGPESLTIIEAGMLVSNEPAIYREGEYGIRIENLIQSYVDEETVYGQFLKFDTLSLCYIDKSLIDKSLLEHSETQWLDNYHAMIYEKLNPFLTDSEKEWLRKKTEPL
jgi:Xaa-Pro aminopeptidase